MPTTLPLTSPLLTQIPGILHGFGTCSTPQPAFYSKNPKPHLHWKQVHGTCVVEVLTPGQNCGEADAFFTSVPGVPLAIMTADCVPILMARRDGQCVAAVHAGWRGTRAHILRALWETLAKKGEQPSQWIAAVGPAIGPCCYEVSEELAQDFKREFATLPQAVPNSRHLDLPLINAEELRSIGIGSVDLLRACTLCSRVTQTPEPLFHSYRRDASRERQYSAIQIS